jgi:redox-sensitive bicupin YhaK (pirin superfamily)
MHNPREVSQVIRGMAAADGDGVKLTRLIGSPYLEELDPFLLLDAFGSDSPQDYIGGFPSHPHRGFETVTYMLAGSMRHEDSAGNAGVIEAGGVQWMTAGKGIIHSEMPQQSEGLLAGFQLWVNLPSTHKMTPPTYQERTSEEIPVEVLEDGTRIKVIAGQTHKGTQGVINNALTEPVFWDVSLSQAGQFDEALATTHNAFIYVIEGELIIGAAQDHLVAGQLAVLGSGDSVVVGAAQASRFLLIAAKPLNEPVERAGPFVMNTRAEIEQAFADYRQGRLA